MGRTWAMWLMGWLVACGGEPLPTAPKLDFHRHDAVGLPDCGGTLLLKEHYIVCHDDMHLVPQWVAYVLRPDLLDGPAERTDNFRADTELPADQRSALADYSDSPYDRGHLAPAGDFTRSEEAMSSTFLLSNIFPQNASLNRGEWRDLESHVRDRVAGARGAWIVSGTLFGAGGAARDTLGDNGVGAPLRCYKAVLLQYDDLTVDVLAVLMPNDREHATWPAHQLSVDELELAAELDLFASLASEPQGLVEALSPEH